MLFSDNHNQYGTEIDIWSTGMVFTEIILGFPLTNWYFGDKLKKILATIFDLSSYKSPLTKNIVPAELSKYLESRSKVPLDPNLLDLLVKMMDVNPTTRISAKNALNHPYFKSMAVHTNTTNVSIPRPKFLEPNTYDWTMKHPELTVEDRSILVRWLKSVNERFKYNVETYSQCIEIIDAFMTKTTEQIHKTDLQLVGVAAMLISSAMNEVIYMDLDSLIVISDRKYKEEQLVEMSWSIFDCLQHLMPRSRLTLEVIQKSSSDDLKLICEKYCSSFPTTPVILF
jgi:serine/threonine protein kinase